MKTFLKVLFLIGAGLCAALLVLASLAYFGTTIYLVAVDGSKSVFQRVSEITGLAVGIGLVGVVACLLAYTFPLLHTEDYD